MTVGESLRIVRNRVGLRQNDLARRAGISQSLLSLIENNHRQPTVGLVQSLCKAMRVPVQLVLLLSCEAEDNDGKFRPALEKLSLTMLELFRAVRQA